MTQLPRRAVSASPESPESPQSPESPGTQILPARVLLAPPPNVIDRTPSRAFVERQVPPATGPVGFADLASGVQASPRRAASEASGGEGRHVPRRADPSDYVVEDSALLTTPIPEPPVLPRSASSADGVVRSGISPDQQGRDAKRWLPRPLRHERRP